MMQSEEKLCVVVLFGGMSSEHEVSRVSAGTFVDNLDRARYEVLTVGITREGRWLCTEATSAQMADGSWEELPGNMPCVISPDRADHGMILFTPSGQVEKLHVDVVIPALHGLWGEDGTVQGLLELAGIPYVGCGVLASAVCMDKAVANALFDAAGIPHTKWLSACRWEIESDLDGVCDGAIAKLGWPIFVKPANAERYFNFEMNCGGKILLYHVRNCRSGDYIPVPADDLATIELFHTLPERITDEITEPVTWRLGFRIPVAFFVKYSNINPELSGQKWTANFTKCADATSHPHWLSWQALPKCDFHLPDYFGELAFE